MLHRAFFNSAALRRQDSGADAVCEDLEDWDGVGNVGEVGGDPQVPAEGCLDGPVSAVGTPSGRSDATLHIPSRSVVISECLILGGRWERCQDIAWGDLELK